MKAKKMIGGLAAAFLLTAAISAQAICEEDTGEVRENQEALTGINSALHDVKIEKVHLNKELNMYEVSIAGMAQPVYLTKDYRYAFIGSVIDVASRKTLTPDRSGKPKRIDFSSLPLENAVRISEGSKRLAVFLDPDCPYSQKIYPELKKLTDVSVHIFLYPLVDLHPKAKEKSISAWCSGDRVKAQDRLFNGTDGEMERKECPNPIESNITYALRNNIKGVPAMVLEDGRVISGYMKAGELMNLIKGE